MPDHLNELSSINGPYVGDGSLETRRERVKRLYIEEDRPLKEVMNILRQEGCNASRNMYIKKIHAWGLEKYNKHEDMVKFLKTIQDAKKENPPRRPHVFQLRGRKITEAEVLKYFKRKETSPKDVISFQVEGLVSSQGGSSQQPSERHPRDLKMSHMIALAKIRHPLGRLESVLIQPEALRGAETLFYAISSLQTRTTTCFLLQIPSLLETCSGENYQVASNEIGRRLWKFVEQVNIGAGMIAAKQLKNGFACVEQALRALDQIVQHGHPEMISSFFGMIHGISASKCPEISTLIFQYFHRAAKLRFGLDHDMTLFAREMYQNWDSPEVMQAARQIAYDATTTVAGKDSLLSFSYHYVLLEGIKITKPPLDNISLQYEDLIHHSELFEKKALVSGLKRDYGEYLAENGRFSQGIAMLRGLASGAFQEDWPDRQAGRVYLNASADVACLLMEQPRLEYFQEDEALHRKRYSEAESFIKMAVDKSNTMLGPQDPTTLALIHRLGDFYTQYGNPDEGRVQFESVEKLLEDFHLTPDQDSQQL